MSQQTINNLDDLKKQLVYHWNRIPLSICESLCNSFNDRIDQLIITKGNRIRPWHSKKKTSLEDAIKNRKRWLTSWNTRNPNDDIKNIVYNDEVLQNIRKKQIDKIRKQAEKNLKKAKDLNKLTKNKLQASLERDIDALSKETRAKFERDFIWSKLNRKQHEDEMKNKLESAVEEVKFYSKQKGVEIDNRLIQAVELHKTCINDCDTKEKEDISIFYRELTNERRKKLTCDYREKDQIPDFETTRIDENDVDDALFE